MLGGDTDSIFWKTSLWQKPKRVVNFFCRFSVSVAAGKAPLAWHFLPTEASIPDTDGVQSCSWGVLGVAPLLVNYCPFLTFALKRRPFKNERFWPMKLIIYHFSTTFLDFICLKDSAAQASIQFLNTSILINLLIKLEQLYTEFLWPKTE